jgi:hypothetical protein
MFPLGDGAIIHLNHVLQRHRGVGRPHREVISWVRAKGLIPTGDGGMTCNPIASQERL